MGLHPDPSENMLLPFMTNNIAQITRTWIAESLLSGTVPFPTFPYGTQANYSDSSIPGYLYPWDPHCKINITSREKTNQVEQKKIAKQPIANASVIPHTHHTTVDSSNGPSLRQSSKCNPTNEITITPQLTQTSNNKHNKKGYRKSQRTVKPPDQPSLFDMKFTKPVHDGNFQEQETWGHEAISIDKDKIFRVLMQNPRGLKLGGDQLNTQYSLAICHSMGAGALCLPETTTNWGHRSSHEILKGLLRKTWKHSSYSISYTKEEFKGLTQPGGTANIIAENWTSRVMEKGTDPYGLGRWSYAVLRGSARKKLMIITAYRVCIQSASSTGPTTLTAQLFRKLSKQFRDLELTEDPRPRIQCIVDLQAWMECKLTEGYEFILCIDANEVITNTSGSYHPLIYNPDAPTAIGRHDGSLATLIRTCGLQDPLTIQHQDQPPPPTYSRGSQRIDYILVSGSLLPAITRSGLLPFDSVFLSDHRPCFLDFDGRVLFQDTTPTIVPSARRKLQLMDPRIVTTYYDNLKKQLDYHKIPGKVESLYHQAQSDMKSNQIPQQYNKLDRIIMESMLYAEQEKLLHHLPMVPGAIYNSKSS